LQASKTLAVGDKVRYTGNTDNFLGLEGVLTNLEKEEGIATFTITKPNRCFNIGDAVHPYARNLELVEETAVGGLLPVVDIDAKSMVVHPAHYGGDTTYEVIKVAEAWGLDKDAYLFNVLKYVGRAGKKAKSTLLEDLKKGRFYLDRRIKSLEEELSTTT
jgi:Protein of unknwon function (DUF3310).